MICNICSLDTYLDEHHIQSKSLGGGNQKWNLTKICPNCHRKVHYGKYIIEGKYFSITSGKPIVVWRRKDEPSITGLPDPPVFIIEKHKYKFKPINIKIGKYF